MIDFGVGVISDITAPKQLKISFSVKPSFLCCGKFATFWFKFASFQ